MPNSRSANASTAIAMTKWFGRAAACSPVALAVASSASAPTAAANTPKDRANRQKNSHAAPACASHANNRSSATDAPASSSNAEGSANA